MAAQQPRLLPHSYLLGRVAKPSDLKGKQSKLDHRSRDRGQKHNSLLILDSSNGADKDGEEEPDQAKLGESREKNKKHKKLDRAKQGQNLGPSHSNNGVSKERQSSSIGHSAQPRSRQDIENLLDKPHSNKLRTKRMRTVTESHQSNNEGEDKSVAVNKPNADKRKTIEPNFILDSAQGQRNRLANDDDPFRGETRMDVHKTRLMSEQGRLNGLHNHAHTQAEKSVFSSSSLNPLKN